MNNNKYNGLVVEKTNDINITSDNKLRNCKKRLGRKKERYEKQANSRALFWWFLLNSGYWEYSFHRISHKAYLEESHRESGT